MEIIGGLKGKKRWVIPISVILSVDITTAGIVVGVLVRRVEVIGANSSADLLIAVLSWKIEGVTPDDGFSDNPTVGMHDIKR